MRRLAIAIAALLPAPAVSAQQTPNIPATSTLAPHPFGQLRVGSFYVAPTFRLTEVGYDTNVFDVSGTERKPGDFTATVEPGVEVGVATDRLTIRTLTRASYIYYQTYKSEQALNPSMYLTAENKFSSHVGLYVRGSYGYRKERPSYEIDSRERTLSQNTTAGFRLSGRKLGLDLHGTYNAITYDDNARFLGVNLATNLNSHDTGGGASIGYALSPYTTLTTGVDEIFHRTPLAPERDTNTLSTFVGLAFHPRAVIAGEATLAFEHVDALSPRTPNFSGFMPRAGITYKLRDHLAVNVGAQRSVENSFYSDRPYYVQSTYDTSVRLLILKHFDVGGGLEYTFLRYQSFRDGAGLTDPTDVYRMETANAGVPIKPQLRIGGFVQRWRRISGDRPYESIRVGMDLTIGPARLDQRGIFLNSPIR